LCLHTIRHGATQAVKAVRKGELVDSRFYIAFSQRLYSVLFAEGPRAAAAIGNGVRRCGAY
jgi:hypothetical protein